MADALRTAPHNGHLMVEALKRHGDKPVMHLGDTTLTGRETAARISQYVQAFEALGAGTGSHAALLALNRPEVLFILGAGQTQGFRRTSLHPLGSADDHAYVINEAGITALIVDPMFTERAVALLEKCPGLEQVLTIGPVPEALVAAGRDLVAEAASYEAQPLSARLLPPDHIVSIAYTGGTTGKPKGVIGTAQTMATMTQVQLAEWEWPEAPRFLMCTPVSQAGRRSSRRPWSRAAPSTCCRGSTRRRSCRPSRSSGSPRPCSCRRCSTPCSTTRTPGAATCRRWRRSTTARRPSTRCGSGRRSTGSARSSRSTTASPRRRWSSATSPRASTTRSGFPRAAGRRRCSGPRCWARTGPRSRWESRGEICVAGPLLAGGYWNLPEETRETFRDDGWLHTGDIAREDEDGFWFIVDRTKDMIVTGGFNVFPREVEDVVAEHPSVAQVGVIGTPDERWGEAVTAIVVLRGRRGDRR